jgi:hypothetical protein
MPGILRRNAVNKQVVADVVEEYSEALLKGEDKSRQLIERYPETSGVVADLFALTNRLYEALVPVEPSHQFVAELKANLANLRASTLLSTARGGFQSRLPARTRIAGPRYTFLSVIAGVALITSLVGSIVMLVALLVGRGRRRHPAAVI